MATSDDAESPRLRKDAVVLTNPRYNTPNTSLLIFHFEPQRLKSVESRLHKCSIQQISVEGKDIYLFDELFHKDERQDLLEYSKKATFSRTSYASHKSREEGEEPARSMNNKEKWEFFAKPPQAVNEVYKLLERWRSS